MGFWDFDDNKVTVEKTVRDIAASSYRYKNEISEFNFNSYIRRFNNEELLSDIIRKLAVRNMDFALHIDFITDIYETICINKDKIEEKTTFNRLFDLYIENPEIFVANNNFRKVASSFYDKQIVLEYFRYIIQHENILKDSKLSNLSQLMEYVCKARQYYVDDRALLSSAINLVNNIDPVLLKYGEEQDIKNIIDKQLEEDRKSNGIYNFDEGTIADLDAKIAELNSGSQNIQSLLSLAQQTIAQLREESANGKNEISQTKLKVLAELSNKANALAQNFDTSYMELLNQQRESLVNERDAMIGEFDRRVEKAKSDITSLAAGTNQRVTIELGRIRDAGKEVRKNIEDMTENNEAIRKMIDESKGNDTLAQALAYATQLNQQTGFVLPVAQATSESNIEMPAQGAIAMPNIILPGTDHEHGRIVEDKINYFFDKRIPFSERFAEFKAQKERRMREEGTIYHEKFDVLGKMVMIGKKPAYLVGSSGVGKTYTAKQLAELLGLNIVADSYINYEQEILGYTNAGTGAYVPTNFYRCYKYGDIYLLDEMDNGRASATIVLNSFMSDGNKSYTFPDGITIQRHPNFRMIAAGNTKGHGCTEDYSAREKLDESTLQRMSPVEFEHDNRITQAILKKYPDWYEFALCFRNAVESWAASNGNDSNSTGTFTTRDADTIREYKDNQVFNNQEIMLYEFIGTKDDDTLSSICSTMSDSRSSLKTSGAKQLLDLFVNSCEEKAAKELCKRR